MRVPLIRGNGSSRSAVVRCLLVALVFFSAQGSVAHDASADAPPAMYSNPLPITLPDGTLQTDCADPTVLQSQTPGDSQWYAFCTTDSLNDADVDSLGVRRSHLIPMLRSSDLVHWQYLGDAFGAVLPAWMSPTTALWAPAAVYRNGSYYLYYTVTDVADAVSGAPGCTSDAAIGVATSASLAGPWVDHGAPVVAPRSNGPGCNFFWTYDPALITDASGQSYLYYGSYYGGIETRPLSADGFTTDPATAVAITIPNRYEGADVVENNGYYYIFASASNCCNGQLTGYQVFAGRSTSPLGPFVDSQGVALLDSRAGGDPVLTLSGNRWVGTGGNTVFQDAGGNWFTVFHAVDRNQPYFAGSVGYTRRPLLLDRLTWDGGWPKVRRGLGASDTPQVAPVGQIQNPGPSHAVRQAYDAIDDLVDPNAFLLFLDAVKVSTLPPNAALSDEFNGTALAPQWSWIRPPSSGFSVSAGTFNFDTQAGDLNGPANTAPSVLVEATPAGNYLVETKVTLNLPSSGCCQNFAEAGVAVYGGDSDYVRLSHVSIWETRQTEFAEQIPSPAPGYPNFGTSVGAPPDATTWLRIAKVTLSGSDHLISYVSRDGTRWRRGAVWVDAIGPAQLALLSMSGTGFTANFDYVHVYTLP
jgi:arabinan endo-1,5-alpha-L-arabinosidase